MTKVITIKLSSDLYKEIELYTVNNKLTVSEFVRNAIIFYLRDYYKIRNIKEL